MTIGQRVKKERLRLKMSLRDLEKKTGISNACICQIEKQDRDFGVRKLIKFAKAFDVTTDYLLGLQQPSPYSQP